MHRESNQCLRLDYRIAATRPIGPIHFQRQTSSGKRNTSGHLSSYGKPYVLGNSIQLPQVARQTSCRAPLVGGLFRIKAISTVELGATIERVLFIDDSRAIRRLIGNILKEMGWEVAEATDGPDALAQLDNLGCPDLILVDWNMPEMNGLEFIKAA